MSKLSRKSLRCYFTGECFPSASQSELSFHLSPLRLKSRKRNLKIYQKPNNLLLLYLQLKIPPKPTPQTSPTGKFPISIIQFRINHLVALLHSLIRINSQYIHSHHIRVSDLSSSTNVFLFALKTITISPPIQTYN